MKLFKLSIPNAIQYNIQTTEGGSDCSCSDNRCVWQCLPSLYNVGNEWTEIASPCGCTDCAQPTVSCSEANLEGITYTTCIGFDSVSRKCFMGYDENDCAIIGECGDSRCIYKCSVENPCEDKNPCCTTIVFCDDNPTSATCGQCIREQDGEVSDCFNCPACDNSMCDPTNPPPPGPPPPPPPPPPPGPPSPPSPPPSPDPDPPCRKYVSGTLEKRGSDWICVDKITRQEIGAECCDLPPPPNPSLASIMVTWNEDNGDLVGSWSGIWNLANYNSSGQNTPSIGSEIGTDAGPLMLSCSGGTGDRYVKIHTSTSPMTFSKTNGSASGDLFQINEHNKPTIIIDLPGGYLSNTPISGAMIFSNESISSVFGTQLDNGPVLVAYDGMNNSITFQSALSPPSPPSPPPTSIGPTPIPNTNNPCSNIEILNNINDILLFEQICSCKCDARYICFDGHCVQDPTGPHDSYLSCLNYLCGSGDCSSSTIPDPTPLPPILPVCQEPLIINQ
jgi:hypothetical protein